MSQNIQKIQMVYNQKENAQFLLSQDMKLISMFDLNNGVGLENQSKKQYKIIGGYKTQEMEIEQIESYEQQTIGIIKNNKIFIVPLNQIIQIASKENNKQQLQQQESGNKDQEKRKEIIINEIGSMKSKKIMKKIKANEILEKNLKDENQMKQKLVNEAPKIKREMKITKNQSRLKKLDKLSKILPPFDLHSKTKEGIYQIISILPDNVRKYIDISTLYNNEVRSNLSVQLLMKRFQLNTEDLKTSDLQNWQFLSYMLSIYQFKNIKTNSSDLAQELNIPIQIVKYIIDNFYQVVSNQGGESSYTLGRAQIQKFVSHMAVLILLCDNYVIKIQKVFSLFKMSIQTFTLICKQIGCKIETDEKGEEVARLYKLCLGSQ